MEELECKSYADFEFKIQRTREICGVSGVERWES
jgi:hypothetical protein